MYFLDKNIEFNEDIVDYQHSWASSPKTLGSLATMYIAVLFMKKEGEEIDNEKIDEIEKMSLLLTENNIYLLISINLKSEFDDRKELTILLIVFLITDNKIMLEYFINHKVKKKKIFMIQVEFCIIVLFFY